MNSQENRVCLPNFLLVSGSGRNVGKTTAGCAVVAANAKNAPVFAMKISPHFHPLTSSLSILFQSSRLVIAEEYDSFSGKDSSRYLAAGAKRVFYVQVLDEKLPELVQWIRRHIHENMPVVCETASLGSVVIPGGGLFVQGVQASKKPTWDFQHKVLNWIEGPGTSSVDFLLDEKNRWI